MSYSTIQKSVIQLYKQGAKRIKLDELSPRDPIGEKRGKSGFSVQEAGLHIPVPPFTEKARTTYLKTIAVPENATQVEVEVIQSVTMLDAEGFEYKFNYTQP